MIGIPGQMPHEVGNLLSVYWYVNSTLTRVPLTCNESGSQSGFNSSLFSRRIKKPVPSAAGFPPSINSPVAVMIGAALSFLQAVIEIKSTNIGKIRFLMFMLFELTRYK